MDEEKEESFDVIVVGAGISGISMMHFLQTLRPRPTFVCLEKRDQMFGTWDLFRYPGIRSDSDMVRSASQERREGR